MERRTFKMGLAPLSGQSFVAVGSWQQALARGRANQAALATLHLHFSPGSVAALANEHARPIPAGARVEAGPVQLHNSLVCLVVATDAGVTTETMISHRLRESEKFSWECSQQRTS